MRTLAILALSLLAPAVSAEPAKVAGKWNVTMQLESITGHPIILLKQDGEKLTGTYEGRYGQSELKGSIKDKEIEFTVSIVAEGMQTQGVFAGKVEGDTMGGEVSFEGAGDGTWSATRAKQ
ncbi:MAG TPA: hypothetical protein VFT39_20130 [Vicinamibacterales bacterium]|nr:hypothetical protein [Vicinamibacterales bacterium]